MKMIYADELVKDMERQLDFLIRREPLDSRYRGGFEQALFCVDMANAVDAEPVVRCKYCKNARAGAEKPHLIWCNKFDNVMRRDDFCSLGERKER